MAVHAAEPASPPLRHPNLGEPVATYPYQRLSGDTAFVICRFAPKDFRPAQLKNGRWAWNLTNAPVLLYQLPQVDEAIAAGTTIWIVDGEKDADALTEAGAVATCCARAQNWTLEHSEQLTSARRIRIVADRDNGTGQRQAQEIVDSLVQAGALARMDIEIVHAAQGKDAYDHLQAGFALDEFILTGTSEEDEQAASSLRVVTFDEFIAITEDIVEPLIGTPDETLLPADGLLLMYGDGGAGKTTLSIDALAHLAAGQDWLGVAITTAATILLIENEGPRGPFRRKLQRKHDHWQGDPFTGRVHVLEEPWTRFTLSDQTYRDELAREIDRTGTDLVIVGPLASLGAKGTGTPDDVNEFSAMLSDLRSRTTRMFALWIVHHENKAGDVSGAWERVPDTLVHVSAQGNGRTRVAWRKVRWSPALHDTSVTLLWNGEGGYQIEEARTRDYQAEILDAFGKDDRWRTAREASGLIGSNVDRAREAMMALVENGTMTVEIGPEGRKKNAKCWRLKTDPDPSGHHGSQGLLEVADLELTRLTRPIKESQEVRSAPHHHETDSDPAGQNTSGKLAAADPDSYRHGDNDAPEPTEDDIPF